MYPRALRLFRTISTVRSSTPEETLWPVEGDIPFVKASWTKGHFSIEFSRSISKRIWGSVYTNAVAFVIVSFSMRLHLRFTRHRLRPLAKPGRFDDDAKRGAFSKRYGFICRVNGETISIWVRLAFWHEICIVRLQAVNLAGRAAPAYAIRTLISGLSWLFQVSCILLFLNREGHHKYRQRPWEMLTFSQRIRSGKEVEAAFCQSTWIKTYFTFRDADTNKIMDSFFSLILPRFLWFVITSAWRKSTKTVPCKH